VAITSIHRAKGNEAPMVYVVGAEACFGGWDLSRKRNIIFTAITRSRAWVRISGVGSNMEKLVAEVGAVETSGFQLQFTYPTEDEINKLKRIHRDRSDNEVASIKKDVESFERLIHMIDAGEIALESLPEKIQAILRSGLRN
ncbi:MAG: ATP-binding domain-containing protein, partial [Rhodocyclaceae bacterium]|nr:ATP-binding domain-containing protein [Rhodocyclaceae bacterium]